MGKILNMEETPLYQEDWIGKGGYASGLTVERGGLVVWEFRISAPR